MKTVKYSLPKQIADDIEQKIKAEHYQIGEKLPTEPELIQIYSASRNTIREAVQSLIHAGILEAKQGKGTYVIAHGRLQVDLFHLMAEINKNDIIEVRTLLEEYIVQAAILHATDEDIAHIEQALLSREQDNSSIKEHTQADLNFHIAIAKSTHNTLLFTIYQHVSSYFSAHIASRLQEPQQQQTHIDQLHQNLLRAIKEKNTVAAQSIIKEIIHL